MSAVHAARPRLGAVAVRAGLPALPGSSVFIGSQVVVPHLRRSGPDPRRRRRRAASCPAPGWRSWRASTPRRRMPRCCRRLVVFGLGNGMAFVPLTAGGLARVAPADTGVASGLVNVTQQLGGAVGLRGARHRLRHRRQRCSRPAGCLAPTPCTSSSRAPSAAPRSPPPCSSALPPWSALLMRHPGGPVRTAPRQPAVQPATPRPSSSKPEPARRHPETITCPRLGGRSAGRVSGGRRASCSSTASVEAATHRAQRGRSPRRVTAPGHACQVAPEPVHVLAAPSATDPRTDVVGRLGDPVDAPPCVLGQAVGDVAADRDVEAVAHRPDPPAPGRASRSAAGGPAYGPPELVGKPSEACSLTAPDRRPRHRPPAVVRHSLTAPPPRSWPASRHRTQRRTGPIVRARPRASAHLSPERCSPAAAAWSLASLDICWIIVGGLGG